MAKIRFLLTNFTIILILIVFTKLNYNNLSWIINQLNYSRILIGIIIILAINHQIIEKLILNFKKSN